MKNKFFTLVLCFLTFYSGAQYNAYQFFCKIQPAQETWHQIELAEQVLGKANNDLSDIRILQIKGKDTFEAPYLIDYKTKPNIWKKLNQLKIDIRNDKAQKKTFLSVALDHKIPLSKIKLEIEKQFDYHRPISLYGSMGNISPANLEEADLLYSGYVNSTDSCEINLDAIFVNHLLLVIENKDNPPLNIHDFSAFFHPVFLTARFEKTGDYLLCFGKPNASFPEYDIQYFSKRIPEKLTQLKYEKITEKIKAKNHEKNTDEHSTKWLWAIMSLVVLILLIFTLRMMQTKS